MKHHIKKLVEKPILAGLISGLVIIGYVGIISTALIELDSNFVSKSVPEYMIPFFMLMLLVLSAAICGIVVFGIPIYFLIQKEIKKAGLFIAAILSTFVFLLIVIANIVLLSQVARS